MLHDIVILHILKHCTTELGDFVDCVSEWGCLTYLAAWNLVSSNAPVMEQGMVNKTRNGS